MNVHRKIFAAAGAAALLSAGLTSTALVQAPEAAAAMASDVKSVPVDPVTQLEMHVTANCVTAEGRCYWDTQANLLTPNGPIGFPGDAWARQTITLRSNDRDTWQEAEYSAPSGMPREVKGANHANVLSKQLKSINSTEISATYFGGGPIERFRIDGTSIPLNWANGQVSLGPTFIACSNIRVVYGGVNLTTPTACAQVKFS